MLKARRYPRSYSRSLCTRLDFLRLRGHRGGIISMHRALLTLPLKPYKIIGSILLVIAMLLAWWLVRGSIAEVWGRAFDFWRVRLAIDGYVLPVAYDLGDWIHFELPLLRTGAAPFTRTLWLWGALWTALLLLLSWLMPRRFMPFAYLVRTALFVQVVAQFFFWFWPEAFPYTLSGYLEVMTLAGFFLMPLIPMLMGFIYYVFDYTLLERVVLTLIILLHLFVLVPLQLTAHAFLMVHFSVLYMPFLFLVLGLPVDVFVFIAFYAWGVSWPGLMWRHGGRRGPFTLVREAKREDLR